MACVAAVNIPKGACSKPFHLHEINVNSHLESWDNLKFQLPLKVNVSATGQIFLVSYANNIFWPKLINIAADCRDQNIKLCRYKYMDTLILQTTQDIPAGQKLQMWFSEELMMSDLEIPPYLSPSNIKGLNSYVCNECQNEFEKPNLLKLHLALQCNRTSLEEFWNRLKPSCLSALLKLLNSSHLQNRIPSMTMPAYPSSSTSKPVIGVKEAIQKRSLATHNQHHHYVLLEAIVSEVGKAENGYSCLYCRKHYLNKCVLRIHIRTHTGYNPQKCKFCNPIFGDLTNLMKHVGLQNDEYVGPQAITSRQDKANN